MDSRYYYNRNGRTTIDPRTRASGPRKPFAAPRAGVYNQVGQMRNGHERQMWAGFHTGGR
nr:hypothetical protein B0A51_14056 [Rachicladosporium sp. CCFEE 5018]